MSINIGARMGVRISSGIAIGPSIGVQLAGRGGGSPAYLLRDLFLTAGDAPLTSPRICEPGPGELTLVQTDGALYITDAALLYAPFDGDDQSLADSQILDTYAEGVRVGALICVIKDGAMEIA